jgi:hypothetical protein
MKETLLTINHVYWLAGATIYVGVLTTLRLFLYPSWHSLTPATANAQFTLPTEAATRFFLRAIPTWIIVSLVMIVTEWGESTMWPAIIAFLGLMTTTLVGWFTIQPINREIKAGVSDMDRLTVLLKRWMKLNDLRWAAVIVMWGAVCWYFVQKPDLPGALG